MSNPILTRREPGVAGDSTLVSTADTKGNVTYLNHAFIAVSAARLAAATVRPPWTRTVLYHVYPILKSSALLPSFPTAYSRLATMPSAGLRMYCTPAPTLGKRSEPGQPLRFAP